MTTDTPHPLKGQDLLLVDTLRSGNAWKIRLACGWMGLDVRRRSLDILQGDLERPEFRRINPFGQVPVLQLPDGTWLAESIAILWYLGRGTPWLPEDAAGQARVVSWLSFEQTQHMHAYAQPRLLVHLRRSARVDDPAIAAWREIGYRAAAIMEAHLATQPYFAGDAPTIADVALYPYTAMAALGGYDLGGHAALQQWLARMRRLPGYVPLLDGEPD
ncbi:glutathione S-transferase family protein [Bordetella genomosp. 13]|uniref:glutathione S-transferase family protein n=1 Tax=Bordetella genomosp. 13 TaxID=463040 RepID=UPI0011A73A9C|nr:glutathione S-transferase family protein [Bordetella genomosp. 13]